MDPSGPRFELIFLIGTTYEGWMDFQLSFVHKGVLLITQDCIEISDWYLQTGLVD